MNQNQNPNGFYDPQTGAFVPIAPQKKKKKVWPWIVAAVVVLGVIGAAANKSEPSDKPDAPQAYAPSVSAGSKTDEAEDKSAEPEADFSDIPTEYILSAGQYYAGIDIPCGKFNLTAVSGSSNVSSSNIYSGGINGLYAAPGEGPDYYKEAYNGIKLPEGERIEISGDLVVRIEYTRIDAGFTGRTEDTENTITLIEGNYDIGTDVPAGLYTVRVIEGDGNVAYNVYGGGLNEIMGEPGSNQSVLDYIPEFKNAWFPAGDELTIRGMTVELVPMIPGRTE